MEIWRKFPLRTVLTVTTGRNLIKPLSKLDEVLDLLAEVPCPHGKEEVYDLVESLTGDRPDSQHLNKVCEECAPILFDYFPELQKLNKPRELVLLDNLKKESPSEEIGTKEWLLLMFSRYRLQLDYSIQVKGAK